MPKVEKDQPNSSENLRIPILKSAEIQDLPDNTKQLVVLIIPDEDGNTEVTTIEELIETQRYYLNALKKQEILREEGPFNINRPIVFSIEVNTTSMDDTSQQSL